MAAKVESGNWLQAKSHFYFYKIFKFKDKTKIPIFLGEIIDYSLKINQDFHLFTQIQKSDSSILVEIHPNKNIINVCTVESCVENLYMKSNG